MIIKKLKYFGFIAILLCLIAFCVFAIGNKDGSTTQTDNSPKQPPEMDGEAPSEKPDGQPPSGKPGSGKSFGSDGTASNGTAVTTLTSENTQDTIENQTYTSTGDDENAVRVDGTTVNFININVKKDDGSSSNTENGDFYGQNAGLLAQNGAQVTIKDSNFSTSAVNGNAVFSYGKGTSITISNSVIRTTQRNSGGIQTTGGATMIANNLDVITQGNSAAAIRSDRGGGTVTVTGGSYVSNGTGSPAIYSTADITVKDATLTSNNSEAIVIEGKNSVSLTNCNLSGKWKSSRSADSEESARNIMIYQSMSGDAEVGHSTFSAEGGTITSKNGDMFYVTNTSCSINLSNVAFTMDNDIFLNIAGNTSSRGWGKQGENGGKAVLTTTEQIFEGQILVDEISSLEANLTDGTVFTGSINSDTKESERGEVSVTLDNSSKWIMSADSYITSFTGDMSRIESEGHHLFIDGKLVL